MTVITKLARTPAPEKTPAEIWYNEVTHETKLSPLAEKEKLFAKIRQIAMAAPKSEFSFTPELIKVGTEIKCERYLTPGGPRFFAEDHSKKYWTVDPISEEIYNVLTKVYKERFIPWHRFVYFVYNVKSAFTCNRLRAA